MQDKPSRGITYRRTVIRLDGETGQLVSSEVRVMLYTFLRSGKLAGAMELKEWICSFRSEEQPGMYKIYICREADWPIHINPSPNLENPVAYVTYQEEKENL